MKIKISQKSEQYWIIVKAWSDNSSGNDPFLYWLEKYHNIKIKYSGHDAFIVCEDTDWTMFLLRYS